MIFFIYDAWLNNPWLLLAYALIILLLLIWLGLYTWRAYLGPDGWHDNPIIGQKGEIVRWDTHDKRIKVKDVFWQVQPAKHPAHFKVGDWVQVIAQDNLVLTISHIQPTE